MAKHFRGTLNYVWSTKIILGTGASGTVFQGISKSDGEPVAVKIISRATTAHSTTEREYEVLQKVNHENIVKLLAIEQDLDDHQKVIVMELCIGGSLYDIINEPEHGYGLLEEDFLSVLEHLTAGMKYLHDNKIVHRDLKPGNIMKTINDAGKSIYKLTDFGSARELESNQEFMSLCGTEEYLHPDIYKRALVGGSSLVSKFNSKVDLWSIGATLYHTATGSIPFRPFEGRKNKKSMHFLTTKKPKGSISGVQNSEGHIEWSSTLPPSCLLSDEMKKYITPLLAGLLDVKEMWSFDRFFQEVMIISRKKCFSIFFTNSMKYQKYYLDGTKTLLELQHHIQKNIIKIPSKCQEVICNGDYLKYNLRLPDPFYEFFKDNSHNLLMLHNIEDNQIEKFEEPDFSELSSLPLLNGKIVESYEEDANNSKITSVIGFEVKRRIEQLITIRNLCLQSITQYEHFVKNNVTKLVIKIEAMKRSLNIIFSLVEMLKFHQLYDKITQSKLIEIIEKSGKLENNFNEIEHKLKELHNQIFNENLLNLEWKNYVKNINEPTSANILHKTNSLASDLKISFKNLQRDCLKPTITHTGQEFHQLERIKVIRKGEYLKNLLLKEVQPSLTLFAKRASDWHTFAQLKYTLQVDNITKNIENFECNMNDLKQVLPEILKTMRMHDEKCSPMLNVNVFEDIKKILFQNSTIIGQMEELFNCKSS